MAGTTPPRPELSSFGTLWTQTWNNYRAHARIYIPIAIIGVLASIIGALATWLAPDVFTLLLMRVVVGLAGVVLNILAGAAMIYAVIHAQEVKSFSEAFQKSWPFLGRWIVTNILVALIVIGGLILFIIPGIIWAITYMFSAYLVLRENVSGMDALRRSKALTNGRWFDVFWRNLVFFLILGCISLVAGAILSSVFSHWKPLGSMIKNLVSGILTPLGVVFLHYLYESVRSVHLEKATNPKV